MIKWLKMLFRIVRKYSDKMDELDERISYAIEYTKESREFIRKATTINVDVSPSHRDDSQIVVIGRYRDRDYIQTYTINGDNLKGLMHTLADMQRYGVIGRVDAMPMMKAVMERDLRL